MADELVQELNLSEREKLYTKFTEKDSYENLPDENNLTKVSKGSESIAENKNNTELTFTEDEQTHSLISDFNQLPFMQYLWYCFLSIFSRKSAEGLFRESQLNKIRQDIVQQNSEIIVFNRKDNIHLVSSYLPARFNEIFQLSLQILPIINQVDRNTTFMQAIVTKLVFADYRSNSGNRISIEAENFISQEQFRDTVFMGDSVVKGKIGSLMEDVRKESRFLPLSLHKSAGEILKALYQFQKICYFPFSNFFHNFRADAKQQDGLYCDVLPQEAYDSIHILYQLMEEVGSINFDKIQFREIISSYFHVVDSKGFSSQSNKTAVHFLDAFSQLQILWNRFLQEIPIRILLLFTGDNPYLILPHIRNIENEILENLPRQIEKVYQQLALEKLEMMAEQLKNDRTEYFFTKYLSGNSDFEPSPYYNNDRIDFLPSNHEENRLEELFAHCKSFSYLQNFLRYFCIKNILKPLNMLSKILFNWNNYVYGEITEFLSGVDHCRVKLDIIEQHLQPEHLIDKKIKEILMRVEQRAEGSKEEYTSTLMGIDKEICYLIEQTMKKFQEFTRQGLPAIEVSIADSQYYLKFNSLIPHFQYMQDYNNPEYAPLTPARILELWKQYIREFCLLLGDQLAIEKQSILGEISRKLR